VLSGFTVNSATQITATVPCPATTGTISVTTPGGTGTSAGSFTVTAPGVPVVSSFNPTSGPVSQNVEVAGCHFIGVTDVRFNGLTASAFHADYTWRIIATVPPGATTGPISVTAPGGTGTSTSNFTVSPWITSFSPTSGPVGTVVTITGANFTGATTVKFKNKSAAFTVNSATQITATVPSGATTGKISVTTPAGTGSSAGNFTVTGGAFLAPFFLRPSGRDEVERVASLSFAQVGHGFDMGWSAERFPGHPLDLSFDGGGAASPEDLPEESFEATEPLASVSPASVTAVGRRYFFYTPEMSLMAETELTTNPGAPAVLYEYIWFNGQPVAQVDAGPVTHWTFTDHLGTPLILTDTAGAIYWRAEHEPYGKIFALRTADQHQPLRLPGQEAEQLNLGPNGATERSYNIFRWYRNGWGRYTQPDPIDLRESENLFGYASQNPVFFLDPTGLCCEAVDRTRDLLLALELVRTHNEGSFVNQICSGSLKGCGHNAAINVDLLNRNLKCYVARVVDAGPFRSKYYKPELFKLIPHSFAVLEPIDACLCPPPGSLTPIVVDNYLSGPSLTPITHYWRW
jgi:RHS repeat-associated protein